MWDIREALGKNYTDQLLVNALRLQSTNFSELLETLLVADDNDADLNNGTPNINTICQSFYDNHGIWADPCAGYTLNPNACAQPSDCLSVSSCRFAECIPCSDCPEPSYVNVCSCENNKCVQTLYPQPATQYCGCGNGICASYEDCSTCELDCGSCSTKTNPPIIKEQ